MTRDLKRYDVILVDFGQDTIGSEQGGIRPSIIVQNNAGNRYSSTTIVMPCTTKIHKNPGQPTHTLLMKGETKGLGEDSMVLGEAMRQISEKRIIKYLGTITDEKEKSEIRRVYNANFGE